MKSKIQLPFIVLLFWIFVNSAFGKVTPPNYDFKLDDLKIFMPGQDLLGIQKKLGKGELISRKNGTNIFKYYVSHQKFKFPVMIQVYNNKVLDLYASLPSYFLHDIFHQSLINRYQKQNKYLNKDEHSVYIWNKNNLGNKVVYAGACTITCFPLYYTEITSTPPQELGGYIPIIDLLNSQEI